MLGRFWAGLLRLTRTLPARPRTMEITAENFREKLPDIEKAIDTATFLAIDGEFTGLSANRGISPFDLPSERYDKLQESARQFLLVQFGLAAFHYSSKTDTYTYQAYNFYVWPRPCSRNAPDPRFLCQTSSIDFLTKQNFDFNRLFKHGVSYLRPAELEKLKETLTERQEQRRQSLNGGGGARDSIVVPEEQEQFLAGVHSKIEKFMAGQQQQLELERCNGFQRRLIYQTTREKYTGLSLTSVTKDGGERVICVVKAGEEEQERLTWLKDKAELSDLDEAFGFSRVIQRITASGRLVVGHNMILDLLHSLNQFAGPLPTQYQDFKVMCGAVFPKLLDTKLMASTSPLREEIPNSSLEELHRTVGEAGWGGPRALPGRAGTAYSVDSERYHEAAYDAYVTGLCFVAMARRLGKLSGDKTGCAVLPNSPLLQPFLNKLFLMKMTDIPYMNLAAEDLQPDRGHVFHLTFPKEWKTADIIHLFSQFGFVFVSWLDDTHTWVSLKERELAGQVLSVLKSNETFQIQSYDAAVASRETAASTSITPMVERLAPFPRQENQKRAISPPSVGDKDLKRHKSVTEEAANAKNRSNTKTFDEPEWD